MPPTHRQKNKKSTFGIHELERIAFEISEEVNDEKMTHRTPMRAATALHQGLIAPEEIREILIQLHCIRASGALNSAGAFFTAKLQDLFKERGIEWVRR